MSRGRREHLLFVSRGNVRLLDTQIAKSVEELFGRVLELVDRAGQHRIGDAAIAQRAEHGLAQQQDFCEEFVGWAG